LNKPSLLTYFSQKRRRRAMREIKTEALIIMNKQNGCIVFLERPLGAIVNNLGEVVRTPYGEIWGWCKKCEAWRWFLEADHKINNSHRCGRRYECMKCDAKFRKTTIFKESLKHLNEIDEEITF